MTGRMNVSSAARPASAITELIDPAKSTRKPTTAIDAAATHT